MASSEALTQKLEEIHNQYRSEFAGRSRVTRQPDLLDAMIGRVQEVLVQAADAPAALSLGREREALYRKERDLIREALAGGPDVAEASALHDWSYLVLRRYGRNFAGRPRASRDLSLLDELLDLQSRWLRRFDEVAARHESGWQAPVRDLMAKNEALFASERGEILKARAAREGQERMSDLARRANEQFQAYRTHFAEKSRKSRHVPLLARVLRNLEGIHAEMVALRDGGFVDERHKENIGKVDQRIQHHRRELQAIQQARAGLNAGERSSAYAGEANTLFGTYRSSFAGRDRTTVDPDQLHEICEQLQVVAQQMEGLDRESGLEANRKNLAIVVDNLKRYEREFERILEAKRSQGAPAPA